LRASFGTLPENLQQFDLVTCCACAIVIVNLSLQNNSYNKTTYFAFPTLSSPLQIRSTLCSARPVLTP
jgi:hypothetical protein